MSRKPRGAFDGIDRRLTLGYVGVLAGILLVFGTVLVLGYWLQSQHRQDEVLVDNASRVSGDPSPPDGPREFGFEPEAAVYSVASDGSISLERSTGSSLGIPVRGDAVRVASSGDPVVRTVRGQGGSVRVASVPVESGGRVVAVVQSAQSSAFVRSQVARLALVAIPVGAGALLLAGIGGMFVSRRAMRPVEISFERQRAFVADASHELKTPLTLIRADAEVLARGDLPEEDRGLISDLLEETDRMSDILSDLLLLARLDAGHLSVSRQPFDLRDTVRDTVDRFQSRAVSGGVTLEVDFSGSTNAAGDPERTGQIIAAVLDNALRYTPPGGDVFVSVGSDPDGTRVDISDGGPGISDENLPRVFDRFFRAEEARTREGGGTGLGLAIARDLARAQGGELTAANGDGSVGAVFRLVLPAAGVVSQSS